MFHIVLYQPEIPPNTGNIIRLCANSGAQLHLIQPLGFELDDRRLRRAGLDYHEFAAVQLWPALDALLDHLNPDPGRVFAFSTRGKHWYTEGEYRRGDVLMFGPESRGLPLDLLQQLPTDQVRRLPMRENSRSLNLSNTVAIVLYEAWRQNRFEFL